MKLYSYFRSSAAFRVRIALNLKGLEYEQLPINLREGEQKSEEFKAVNPLGLVPALETEQGALGQSLAIMEWLDEAWPQTPLLPDDSWQKARVRAMAYSIACDIHPLDNLRVLKYLKTNFDQSEDDVTTWYHHWIAQGFDALEQQVEAAPFCVGDKPTLADICLIPQVSNAKRFSMNLTSYPKIVGIWEHCMTMDAFKQAVPENQPDSM
ncbi:maleylacetoacetate isomerase [Sansalvadorimonas verongulae]|uniref:maleylacetoacetate isomerase n=1 Tax=Sansalvadorimonas verongulae TaxID=2172824 RepID=UPI0012BC2EDD|nr:maleylacetoacetate isomerase [Sansalvadorimonas verongulae]MTI13057.1 maleylacetoacetate isomerase [Sansalvadorimonas verongulae]